MYLTSKVYKQRLKNFKEAGKMALWLEVRGAESDDVSLIPRPTRWKEEPDSQKLSSCLLTQAVAHVLSPPSLTNE